MCTWVQGRSLRRLQQQAHRRQQQQKQQQQHPVRWTHAEGIPRPRPPQTALSSSYYFGLHRVSRWLVLWAGASRWSWWAAADFSQPPGGRAPPAPAPRCLFATSPMPSPGPISLIAPSTSSSNLNFSILGPYHCRLSPSLLLSLFDLFLHSLFPFLPHTSNF